MALTNNTTGASIYELGNIVKADSIAEVSDILKDSETRIEKQRAQQMQQEREMQEKQLQSKAEEAQMKLQAEMEENEKNRQNEITVAEIRAAGFGAQSDINQNQVSDYQDAMKDIRESTRYQEQSNLKREELNSKSVIERGRLDVEKQKISADIAISQNELQIARENKNKYDNPKSKKNKDK